ncbi:MAG: hypothetical protein RLZZ407_1758 [Pseudomonadota bacterium]|jgi:hypothetical protein
MRKRVAILLGLFALLSSGAVVAKPAARAKQSAPEREYAVSYAKNYFLAQNGYEQIVRVKFLATDEAKAIIPANKLMWIANLSDFSCKLGAKNQLSYVPFSMFLYGGEDGSLGSVKVAIEWLGKNGYGAESKSTCFFQLKPDYTPYDAIRGF